MLLKIKPELNSKILKDCEQRLRITAEQDLDEIKLDIAELYIKEVASLTPTYQVMSADDKIEEDKLAIKLNKKLPKHATIELNIKYSAGYYHHNENDYTSVRTPRSGFHFIADDENHSPAKQAWTQGEMLESRYWFPCIDDHKLNFLEKFRLRFLRDIL